MKLVLLQHADGRTALERGDVAAWAGLDPIMAAAEIESHARLFYRNPAANTWGVLNVREEFATANPPTWFVGCWRPMRPRANGHWRIPRS